MALEPLQVRTIFPIPLVSTTLVRADELKSALLAEIVERQAAEESVARSNLGGWDSKPDFFMRDEPAQRELAEVIDEFIGAACDQMMPGVLEQAHLKREGWISVGSAGAMRAPHDHAGSFWSGSYYVDVPSGSPDAHSTGAIEFVDPRGSIGTNALIRTPFTEPRVTILPKAGMLLLWPSFLKHWVHPNPSTEDRTMIAFNAWFGKKGA